MRWRAQPDGQTKDVDEGGEPVLTRLLRRWWHNFSAWIVSLRARIGQLDFLPMDDQKDAGFVSG